MKVKERAKVLQQSCIAADIYDMTLAVSFAGDCVPGQFVSLMTEDGSRLMPRPISICGIEKDAIRLVYRVAGSGTADFSALKAGDEITVIGPMGNGFPLDVCAGKRVLLIGGGIGIPPMLETGRTLQGLPEDEKPASLAYVVGYRTDDKYLYNDLCAVAPVYVSTDDGSFGVHGTVVDAMKAAGLEADVILSCGPKPMLRALKAVADEQGIDLWVSMEEKMACGIGACLACVCQSTEVDHHSHVHNKRVCKDGPVFNSKEVVL
ncbi:MAG: dihydroorotate dehydrogenase electron transfer subunit [Lachnospiraceae bacterium]|nr:dihydroorotate dehydrogenase electron transfer subunit [Lachnospiraceae bacterium]